MAASSAARRRRAEGEVVRVEESLSRPYAFASEQCLQDVRFDLTGVSEWLDADLDLKIDVDETGIADEHFAARLAHSPSGFRAPFDARGWLKRAKRVDCDKSAQPAARPAEAGAGTLDPRQALGNLGIIFRPHGAEREGETPRVRFA